MRNKLLRFVMFYLVWVCIVIGVFMYTLNSAIQTANSASFGTDVPGAIAAPFVVVFGGLGLPWIFFWTIFNRKPEWNKQVLANGKQAPATVINVSDTGVSYGN